MRYLALDLGDKRTGVATGDSITRVAAPAGVIEVPVDREGGEALLVAIEAAVARELGADAGSGELVVGLPLNMDGSEGPRAALVRAFAGRMAERTGRAVHLADERLTTEEARWRMARTGMTRQQKKQKKDALAAAVILEAFLVEHPPSRAGSPGGSTEGL
jgi:putative Holliday junction resolvase